jgi:hypothetical protein
MNAAQDNALQRLVAMGQRGDGTRWDLSELRQILRDRIAAGMTGGPQGLNRAFRSFCKHGTSVVDFEHWEQQLRRIGMVMPQEQVRVIIWCSNVLRDIRLVEMSNETQSEREREKNSNLRGGPTTT